MSSEHDGTPNTYEAFEQARADLLGTLAAIAEVDRTLDLGEAAGSIEDVARKIREGVFRVLVLGEFKRGKSTLINAMLGMPLLPANVTPTTALLTVVRYGEEPRAVVHYQAGHGCREVALDDLRTVLVLSADEAENRRRQEEIRLVEVFYPAPLCRNNVEVVDSPGLNEHSTRTDLTSSYITQCDAALFVLSATNFGSLTEGQFLTDHLLGKGLRHIFFAVNQFDRVLADADDPVAEARSLRALARARLGPLCIVDGQDLSESRIHFVSARQALRARQAAPPRSAERQPTGLSGGAAPPRSAERQPTGLTGGAANAAALHESGMPDLEGALEEFLSRDRGRVMLARPLTLARGAIAAVADAVAFRRRALALDLEVLEERARRVEPEFAALQQRKARMLAAIRATHTRVAAAIELSLRRRVGELCESLPQAVEGFTIDASWNPGTARTELVTQINAHIERELSRWAETMGAEVQEDLERLFADLGTDAAHIDASLRRIRLQVLEGDEDVLPVGEESDPRHILEDILSSGGGRFLSDFNVLLGGGPGWLGVAVRVLAFQLAAGALVAALGLTAGPLVAVSTVVGAAILALVSRRSAIERNIRERIVESARPEIARIPERALPSMLEQVDGALTGLSDAVGTGIDVLVDNVQATIAAALADRRARESAIEPHMRRLDLADERLATLREHLDALERRLAAGSTPPGRAPALEAVP